MKFLLLLLATASCAANPFLDSLIAYVDSHAPNAKLGISVRSVKTDSIVYNLKGNEWFTPASTMKLLVTAAALQNIPLDYAPKTLVHLEGIKKGKVFSGLLRLEGRGDPNISGRYYPDPLSALEGFADSIKSMGIDTLRGILELDTSFFRGPRKPKEWRKKFFDSWYGAEVSPLSFNDNCVLFEIRPGAKDGDSAQITIVPDVGYIKVKNNIKTKNKGKYKYAMDPVKPEVTFSGIIGEKVSLSTVLLPVRNPAAYLKAAFLKSLENAGIVYIEDKEVYIGKAISIIVLTGPPLRSIMDEINQRSQNLHAEMLLRILGQHKRRDGSAESGILTEKLFLQNAGLPVEDFKIADGSGLSPQNSLKPNSLTKLLTYMKKQEKGDIYLSSLAIPGITGSGKRLASAEFKERIRFKTGFIEGVHGLAGYIIADNDTLAFALYLNESQGVSEHLARDILDTLAARIAKQHNGEAAQLEAGKILWQKGNDIKDINERINFFSSELKNKPYFLGPTGEGGSIYPSYKQRVNFAEMDCLTYMEHALALAYSKNYNDFFNILQGIRYKNGVIDYNARNHFLIADWTANNKFNFVTEYTDFEIFEKEIDKKKFFKNSGIANPKISVQFLPKEKAIAYADTAKFAGDTIFGVAILSDLPGLDAAHTGFAVNGKKGLMFRHASQLRGRVIEQPLSEFLKTTKIKTPGIAFFRFNY
ncbi:MAG: D-alanyl-D-alanine carboxypeptidase/D-alanyl-D-alanine-endopeptidase [Candidatus Fibromonas sp.]|jgi:D-alanyl-D-alanine carboxypeptidase/D-alanyl-D-alanine-endopeptidase (penicillin-binding protein 4)|nr:D-alanyl-D-alanine carboxypeptidase/D-alanyl-D-alanine-endopeptidase [Candidatus Fibromonas sp.]